MTSVTLSTTRKVIAIAAFTTVVINPIANKYHESFGFQSSTGNTTYSIGRDKKIAVSVSDKISSIIDNLGLNVKDLESILDVKRASIYNWKNGENQPQDDRAIDLINKTYELSERLSSVIEHKFGRLAKTHTYKGSDYISKIKTGADIDDIIEHIRVLNSLISKRNNIPQSMVDGCASPEAEDFVIG